MAVLAGQKVTAAVFNLATEKTVVRARRTTASSSTSGATVLAVMRTDDQAVKAGYLYRVMAPVLHPDFSNATDNFNTSIRYTTDGSTPTTSSPVLPGAQSYQSPEGTPMACGTTYTPAADQTLSLLLCLARTSGVGTATLYADGDRVTEFTVDNQGLDPGNTGTSL